MNHKRDIWEKASPDEKETFASFYTEEVGKWDNELFAEDVRSTPHSNEFGDDVAKFMSQLEATVAK